jgi:hypothetical protein
LAAPLARDERPAVARVARVPGGFSSQRHGHEPIADERMLELLRVGCIVARGATCKD